MALRILFVEDHNDTRHILSQLLRRFGYNVVTAPDYKTASTMLDVWSFDVLLSDIGLPDGSGCDLVAEAKHKQPVVGIALTAFGEKEDAERGLASGFDHYFTKPLDVHQLRTVLGGIAPDQS
jgi:DNA-binding response OmpR family regulator